MSVENDLRWPHKSCRCVLVKDAGGEKRFAPAAVGLARVGSKTFDVAENDRLFGLIEDDGGRTVARASHR